VPGLLAFLGSDFVEQGKRSADAMIQLLGGNGKVAILLGSSGNNVTTDRTKGFVDRIKEKAPRHQHRRAADRRVCARQRAAGDGADHPKQIRYHRRVRRK